MMSSTLLRVCERFGASLHRVKGAIAGMATAMAGEFGATGNFELTHCPWTHSHPYDRSSTSEPLHEKGWRGTSRWGASSSLPRSPNWCLTGFARWTHDQRPGNRD